MGIEMLLASTVVYAIAIKHYETNITKLRNWLHCTDEWHLSRLKYGNIYQAFSLYAK